MRTSLSGDFVAALLDMPSTNAPAARLTFESFDGQGARAHRAPETFGDIRPARRALLAAAPLSNITASTRPRLITASLRAQDP